MSPMKLLPLLVMSVMIVSLPRTVRHQGTRVRQPIDSWTARMSTHILPTRGLERVDKFKRLEFNKQQLNGQDIQWMLKHWPRLRSFRAYYNPDRPLHVILLDLLKNAGAFTVMIDDEVYISCMSKGHTHNLLFKSPLMNSGCYYYVI